MQPHRPARAARPPRPAATQPGQVEKVTSPEGVVREVIRPTAPQFAAARTPQRLASAEIVEKGKQLLARREWDKALQLFQEAITVDGTNGIAYYYLARTRFALHQYVEAMGLLDRAESLLADSPDWMATVGELRAQIRANQP